jgi:hypothetical protein
MNDPGDPLEALTRLELYFSVRHINKALRAFGDLFNHDYDRVAIFMTVAEIGLRAIFHRIALDPNAPVGGKVQMDIHDVGVSALAVSELTGIPRETVRRKLKILIAEGHLAIATKSKTIYLPIEAMTRTRIAEIFTGHVKDVGQLVRAVAYYQRDPV